MHALVAGAIGTIAVIAGGWRRLSAPLLLGTAVLVAAGIAMGRAEVGPIETGRRVLDVVRDRFA